MSYNRRSVLLPPKWVLREAVQAERWVLADSLNAIEEIMLLENEKSARSFPALSDPRNRNHKSLAIDNHNFEIASFAAEIAVKSQCRNHENRIGPKKSLRFGITPLIVVATISGGFPDLGGASETL